jgi:methanogenic corrinoid protein MtbC1
MPASIAPVGTKVRPVRFQSGLLEELERRLQSGGEDLSHFVNAAVDRALHGDERTLRAVPDPIEISDLEDCAAAFTRALLARDARGARALVEEVVHRGAHVIDVHQHVLQPALHEIGDLWCLEEISVAQEHYATEVTTQIISALAPDRRLPPTRGRLAIVGSTPDELHSLGARMVGDVLERAGWEVLALGASTPVEDLGELVAEECPDLVALSTATIGRLPGVEAALRTLNAVEPRPMIAVGGALYDGPVVELARGWGADLVGTDLRELLDAVTRRFPLAG